MIDLRAIFPALVLLTPVFLGARVLAQSLSGSQEPPPARVLLNTTLNVDTGAIVLDEVVVYEATNVRQFAYQDLWRPELITYQNAGSSAALYAHPIPPGTVSNESGNEDSPATEGVRQAVKSYLTDNFVNSVLFDIANAEHGIALRFDPPLVNEPGVDLVIGEMGPAVGSADPYCPDTFAPGGDRLTLQVEGGASITIEPEAYSSQGPLGAMRHYGHTELSEGRLITSVADLETYPALARRIIPHLQLYTTTVDLDALDIPEGESISHITLASAPLEMTIEGEVLQCLTADPAFIFGLSTAR